MLKNAIKITPIFIMLFIFGQLSAQEMNRTDTLTRFVLSEVEPEKTFHLEKEASFEERIAYLELNMRSSSEKVNIEAKVILEEAIASKDLRKEAIVLNILCRSDYLLGNLNEALNYGLLSLERINESKDPDLRVMANAYNYLAEVYRKTGDFTQALDYYLISLETFIAIGDAVKSGVLLGNIGNLYNDIGKSEKAIEHFEEAIELFEPISYKIGLAINNNNLGEVWFKLKDFDKALFYYQKASSLYESLGDIRGISLVANNIGFSYKEKGQTTLALEYLKKSLTLQKSIGSEIGIAETLSNLGSLYSESGDFDSSLYYLNQAQTIAVDKGSLKALELNARNYSDMFIAKGQYEKALHWFMEFKVLSDSSLSAQSNRLLAEMNIKYETDQKEKEISLLKQDKEIQALEKAKDDQFFYFVIFSLLFIVILVYAIFSIRNSRNAKKMLEFERISLRAQMKPHFIFNALSSIQTFILENDLKNADRYLSKFARLIRLILESSKMPTILLEDELHMLKLYIEIEQMRLEDKFEYSIEVNQKINAKSIRIASMLLQPFVENAIWHGISPKEGKGKLLIVIGQEESYIKCMIEDDGVGRSHASEQNKLPGHKSMGIKITEERLNLLHRRKILKQQHFLVDDLKENGHDVGTRVTVYIPFESDFYD